jgi:hypothetical protein
MTFLSNPIRLLTNTFIYINNFHNIKYLVIIYEELQKVAFQKE